MTADTKALEDLRHELELTRNESAALTDALNANRHTMERLEAETRRLADAIEAAQRRGFWQRIGGGR